VSDDEVKDSVEAGLDSETAKTVVGAARAQQAAEQHGKQAGVDDSDIKKVGNAMADYAISLIPDKKVKESYTRSRRQTLALQESFGILNEFDFSKIGSKLADQFSPEVQAAIKKNVADSLKNQAKKDLASLGGIIKGDIKSFASDFKDEAGEHLASLGKMAKPIIGKALEVPETATGKALKAATMGAIAAAATATVKTLLPDSFDEDLIEWLDDDGRDDAADKVRAAIGR